MQKGYNLKNVPDDIREILLKNQLELKLKKNINQFSIEQTIYSIIREWKKVNTQEA